MRTPWIWSVSLGRWWNVHVRLHMFFFIFAAFVIYLTSGVTDQNWLGVACVLTVFLSVLLHEIAHVVVARRLGGIAEDIVISPVGGLSSIRVPYEPHSELVALMAGTLLNGAICFISALVLWVSTDVPLVGLLEPKIAFINPSDPQQGVFSPSAILQLVFWVNWSLILVNLLPVFPFDGGRSLHAVLTFLWPEFDARASRTAICRLGKVLSAVLLLLSWFFFDPTNAASDQPPMWFALMMLSIYIYFNSRREELQQLEVEQDDDTVFGYDFSQGYTSLERSIQVDGAEAPAQSGPVKQGIVGRWLERRREMQLQRQQELEAEDERRVDEVLERLHFQGMKSLSAEDRALLDRVSERYRSRQS